MTSLSDIWGATDSKPKAKASRTPAVGKYTQLREAAMHIHQKIVSMQDQYNTEEIEIDMRGLRLTTGLEGEVFKRGIINLELEVFDSLPATTDRVIRIANVLLDMTNEDWLQVIIEEGDL